MNSRPNLKAILLIIGACATGACATTGEQRGQVPAATTAGQMPSQGAAGGTRTETEQEKIFRELDEKSRYAR